MQLSDLHKIKLRLLHAHNVGKLAVPSDAFLLNLSCEAAPSNRLLDVEDVAGKSFAIKQFEFLVEQMLFFEQNIHADCYGINNSLLTVGEFFRKSQIKRSPAKVSYFARKWIQGGAIHEANSL